MFEFETEVLEVIQRTHDVKSFRFKLKEGADFRPGQFFFVTINVDGVQRTKHFSFSNSPTEKGYVEFTKRITGSEFSKALDRIKIGDRAKIKMPMGSFTFEGEHSKVAFLSGGIGVTPMRSMCKFAEDMKLSSDIVLLYGNNREKDIVFREDWIDITSSNKNIRVVHTLSSPDGDTWRGRTGYINDEMIKEEMPDYKERVFYICGPPKMVEVLMDILKSKLGIEENRIKKENFSGY